MSKWLLGFDASTPQCVLVLGTLAGHTSVLVASEIQNEPKQVSATLHQRLAALLAQGGITTSELSAVLCGRGPGTFTGTRVAIATAKGIGLGLGIAAIGVSTLTALALSAETEGWVVPLLDARRKEVYGGLYRCGAQTQRSPELVGAEACIDLGQLVARASEHLDAGVVPTVIGPGVAPYADALPEAWHAQRRECSGPSPQGLWAACVAAYHEQMQAPEELKAVYLRKSYAELGLNTPKRPFVKSPFA